jgi:hypothetical protein
MAHLGRVRAPFWESGSWYDEGPTMSLGRERRVQPGRLLAARDGTGQRRGGHPGAGDKTEQRCGDQRAGGAMGQQRGGQPDTGDATGWRRRGHSDIMVRQLRLVVHHSCRSFSP